MNKHTNGTLFAAIVDLENSTYALEIMDQKTIEDNANEGFELFFNALPDDDVEGSFNELAVFAMNNGGNITYASASFGSISLHMTNPELVYREIDRVCGEHKDVYDFEAKNPELYKKRLAAISH